jgi:23S rRNA (uracil-5-)-methyltransferase RumA
MQERAVKKNQVLELVISDMAFGGVGIGKIQTEQGEFAVFVQNAIPGQRVLARVEKAQKRFAECKMVEVLEPSPDEVAVPYQAIPGAPYATLPIELQRQYKRRTALELFRRIGKIAHIEEVFDEYIESPATWHYRNKMEYAFSVIRFDLEEKKEYDDFGLGFKHRGTWWCVENLDCDSGLFDHELEEQLRHIRQWCIETGLPAWHPPAHHGFFRYLVVRKSFATNELLINLVTSEREVETFDTNAFVACLQQKLGNRLAGVIHTINPNTGDRIDPLSGQTNLLWGSPVIVENIHGLKFEISMTSFFQTNPRSAEKLYSKVLEYAGVHDSDDGNVILDLFCGTGTITQLLAKESGKKIIGVDIVEAAIQDARRNAERNDVHNLEFFAADVGKFLLEYPQYQGKISCAVLDPPRGGIAPKTLRKIIALGAHRIVYVSCNPATQARDTIDLLSAGYSLRRISLVDQFPHTSHVETVAWFELD